MDVGRRNRWITIFVIVWLLVFFYESSRHFFLQPLFKRPLPKVPFLFPPAGWIMFFRIEDGYGHLEVYGLRDGRPEKIDPHDIIETRTIGYDNIHRNVLSLAAYPAYRTGFCRYLHRKFPVYDEFQVFAVQYPSVIKRPQSKYYRKLYTCRE